MTAFNFADVILVPFPFPFTDQFASKQRPAVVISSARYHAERPDLILMAVTSRIRPVPTFGEVAIADWASSGLLKPSVLKPIVATLEQVLVLRTLGRLSGQDAAALLSQGKAANYVMGNFAVATFKDGGMTNDTLGFMMFPEITPGLPRAEEAPTEGEASEAAAPAAEEPTP